MLHTMPRSLVTRGWLNVHPYPQGSYCTATVLLLLWCCVVPLCRLRLGSGALRLRASCSSSGGKYLDKKAQSWKERAVVRRCGVAPHLFTYSDVHRESLRARLLGEYGHGLLRCTTSSGGWPYQRPFK